MRILKEKGSFRKAAAICRVSLSTLHRWATKGISPGRSDLKRVGRPKRLSGKAIAFLQEFLQTYPVTTIRQMQASLLSSCGIKMGYQAIRSALDSLRVSRKRTSKRHSSGSVSAKTLAYTETFKQTLAGFLQRKDTTIVSLDECYFSEKTLPLYGYSPVGLPCVVRSPTASWKQRSLILAVGNNGSKVSYIARGSIDGEKFRDFLRNLPYPPGAVLLMDNANIHKGATLAVLETKGYIPLFTPPYSPEYNPVENVFSIIKSRFRSSWPWVSGVDASIEAAIVKASPEMVKNTFAHLATTIGC